MTVYNLLCPTENGCGANTYLTPLNRSVPEMCPYCGNEGVVVRVSSRHVYGGEVTPEGEP